MLYYQFQNYDGFKHLFGTVKHSDGTSCRKNKVLLAYLKDKRLLHEAAAANRLDLLRLTNMAGLEAAMEREILKSGDESPGLPYRLDLMGNIYHSSVYETDGNKGLCEDGDTKAVRYVNRKTGKTFKMKAGKLYRSLLLETEFGKRLPQKVVTYLSEKFAADWQVYAMGKSSKSRLHVNQDFKRIYSSECCEGDFASCMTDKGFHHFYKDAVDASAAYIENEDGKVIARCIIFNEVKDEDGGTWRLAERQYASDNNDILKQTLVEALIDGGYIDGYKKVGAGCGDARAFVDNHGNSLSRKEFRISCDLDWGDTLSYQDSFKYYDECARIADNYDHGSLSLEETGGSLDGEDEREYDDYHDYECDEVQQVYVHGQAYHCDINNLGDFVLIESLDEYHHRDDVHYCPQCGACFLEKDRFYSDITQEGYCSEECRDDAEDAYREKYWHYSDYDGRYFEEEEDIAYYLHWMREREDYEERTISVTSLNRLLYGEEFFQFGDLYFNEVDPATNLPYGYKLVKMEGSTMELLKQLYRIYSPSGKERAMRRFIMKEVKKIPGTRIEKDPSGNLYATKGNAPDYPCIVAHMDQVQGTRSTDFMPVETKEVIFGYSPKHRRQENLGADDKNGIWIALKCLRQYPVLKLAFFVSEETGCIGSGNARMDFFTDCRFVIEPDRRGYKDIIPLIGWTVLCSNEFLKATGYENFGYEETEGMLTDVLELKEKGLAVSCINLSCGYYEPHTPHEFTVKKDLLNCLDLVRHIIGHCTGTYPHTHECTGGFGRHPDGLCLYEDEYGEAVDEIFNLLDSDDTLSVEDLTYMYSLYFPNLDRSDFEQIYRDYHELRRPKQEKFKLWQ